MSFLLLSHLFYSVMFCFPCMCFWEACVGSSYQLISHPFFLLSENSLVLVFHLSLATETNLHFLLQNIQQSISNSHGYPRTEGYTAYQYSYYILPPATPLSSIFFLLYTAYLSICLPWKISPHWTSLPTCLSHSRSGTQADSRLKRLVASVQKYKAIEKERKLKILEWGQAFLLAN